MIKKINLILIGLGISLTCKFNFGYILFIPIFLYYLKKDIKTIYYLIPSTLISTILFLNENLLTISLLELILILLFFLITSIKKKEAIKYMFYILAIIVANLFSLFMLNIKIGILFYFLYITLSIIIFIFLCYEDYLYLNNICKQQTLYAEHIIVIITILGACMQNIYDMQLGLVFGCYFTIFYSRTYHNIYSLILGICIFIIEYLGFNQNEGLLIVLLGALYYFEYNYLFFLTNVILLILYFTNTLFGSTYLFIFMAVTILFEFLWIMLIKKQTLKEVNEKDIYELKIDQIEKEYSMFSSFLEYFIDTFKNTKEYSKQLSKAYECITERHCNMCNKKDECYKNLKTNVVFEFKNLIENNDSSKEFKHFCPSFQSINQTSSMLSRQMTKSTDSTNSILQAVLSETKQVLERYQQDIKNKQIIDYNLLKQFHTKLYESSFDIKQIKYNKIFVDDFNIQIIVDKFDLNKQQDLITLITNSFLYPITISKSSDNNNYIYTIVMKEKFHIRYGYGSLSSKQNELCGDNHLIKSYNNGHFLAAISDGMGKGFKAFEDSKRVLDALDSLTYCSTNIGTNIEILNLLYILQGYTERYSTIDAVDINRHNYQAIIYKLGATSSYIFHEDKTFTKLENKCLPLGIEEDIVQKEIILKNKDLIMLTSDGIFENVEEEKQLLDLIIKLKDENPQKIVYEVLEYTLHARVKVKDDMSMIILKIEDIN